MGSREAELIQPKPAAVLELDEPVEIRSIDGNKFIVHIIKPMKDTTFNLSLKYKVSEQSIRNINYISGTEIHTFKEVLIAYHGQDIVIKKLTGDELQAKKEK